MHVARAESIQVWQVGGLRLHGCVLRVFFSRTDPQCLTFCVCLVELRGHSPRVGRRWYRERVLDGLILAAIDTALQLTTTSMSYGPALHSIRMSHPQYVCTITSCSASCTQLCTLCAVGC
jgi:hypothetical protein